MYQNKELKHYKDDELEHYEELEHYDINMTKVIKNPEQNKRPQYKAH